MQAKCCVTLGLPIHFHAGMQQFSCRLAVQRDTLDMLCSVMVVLSIVNMKVANRVKSRPTVVCCAFVTLLFHSLQWRPPHCNSPWWIEREAMVTPQTKQIVSEMSCTWSFSGSRQGAVRLMAMTSPSVLPPDARGSEAGAVTSTFHIPLLSSPESA